MAQWLPRRYALFISHAWDYRDEYDRLVNLLNADASFAWDNLSIPQENPLQILQRLPKSYRYLVRQIDERIAKADCVIVLAGMYAAHSGWIQSEIEAAKEFRKPLIAVEPRGNERFPEAVTHAADERVGWNKTSIISAIRRRCPAPEPPPSTSLANALQPQPSLSQTLLETYVRSLSAIPPRAMTIADLVEAMQLAPRPGQK